jgi:hypothetical protein
MNMQMPKVQWFERLPSTGMTGYAGGLRQMVLDESVKASQLQIKDCTATSCMIFYTAKLPGNKQKFCLDIADRATKKGATGLCYFGHWKHGRKGGGLIGDYDDIMAYIERCALSRDTPVFYCIWTPSHKGLCPVYPFVDIDLKGDRSSIEVGDIVKQIIFEVNRGLTGDEKSDVEYSMVGSVREDCGADKWSLHITWHGYYFSNVEQHKQFIKDIGNVNVDDKVYTQKRVFRVPFTPKSNNGDFESIHHNAFFADDGGIEFSTMVDMDLVRKMDPVVRCDTSDLISVSVNHRQRGSEIRRIMSSAPSVSLTTSQRLLNDDLLSFWGPLKNVLVGKIQKYRKNSLMATSQITASENNAPSLKCGVPVAETNFGSFSPTSSVGEFQLIVSGDTFCEHDDGGFRYHHSRNTGRDIITLQIDLINGRWKQLCQICRVYTKYYSFIGPDNQWGFEEMGPGRVSPQHYIGDVKYGAGLLCHWARDLLLFDTKSGVLCTYDLQHCLWVSDTLRVQHSVSCLKDDMRQSYRDYVRAVYKPTLDRVIRECEDPKKIAREMKRFKSLTMVDPYITTSSTTVLSDVTAYYSSNFPRDDLTMDCHPHLVPMKDNIVVNILTGDVLPRTQPMRVTSLVDATLLPRDDHSFEEVNTWFHQVCCGDEKFVEYLKVLSGYSLSHLTDDRHCYINKGIGSNGKGVYFQMMSGLLTSAHSRRYTRFDKAMLTEKGESQKGPESASPQLMTANGKSMIQVEELADQRLATSFVKSLVSNDEMTGRGLHQSQQQFKPTCKLWINTNHSIEDTDSALWDRIVILPWKARWAKKEGNEHVKFRYEPSQSYVDHFLTLKDAFASVCIYAAIDYFKGEAKRINPPPVVVSTTQMDQQNAYPLIKFFTQFLEPTSNPVEFANVLKLFKVYRYNQYHIHGRRDSTYNSAKFITQVRQMGKHDLLLKNDSTFVAGFRANAKCEETLRTATRFTPEATSYASYSPDPIPDAFANQRELLLRQRVQASFGHSSSSSSFDQLDRCIQDGDSYRPEKRPCYR